MFCCVILYSVVLVCVLLCSFVFLCVMLCSFVFCCVLLCSFVLEIVLKEKRLNANELAELDEFKWMLRREDEWKAIARAQQQEKTKKYKAELRGWMACILCSVVFFCVLLCAFVFSCVLLCSSVFV